MSLSCTVLGYWSKIADYNLLYLYLAHPLEFRQDLWHQKTTYGVVCVILHLAILVQCRLVTDRRTHGQTHTMLA